MDQQHGQLKHKLHVVRVAQLTDLLQSATAADNARNHIRDMVQAKRDTHALSALRAIAMQVRTRIPYHSHSV